MFKAIAAQVPSCDSISQGYECQPRISHFWGQYSPYYSIPSEIPNTLPEGCDISFAQVLSRHGARFPTASKSASYNATIQKIKSNVSKFTGRYAFLANYEYPLGANDLTTFGQQEMANSGIRYYSRYQGLTRNLTPFVRATSEARVLASAQYFNKGYHQARLADKNSTAFDEYPYPITIISEAVGSNNTLSHGLCTNFEDGPDSQIGDNAQSIWREIFTPPITARLNDNLRGANLTAVDTIMIMDLCPFSTIASTTGEISPFCGLFMEHEWHQYDYYETLGKYYGYSDGNPLGPTQGVGFTNELIARLTNEAVQDHTSMNRTLDGSQSSFPVGGSHVLFADFSHDKYVFLQISHGILVMSANHRK